VRLRADKEGANQDSTIDFRGVQLGLRDEYRPEASAIAFAGARPGAGKEGRSVARTIDFDGGHFGCCTERHPEAGTIAFVCDHPGVGNESACQVATTSRWTTFPHLASSVVSVSRHCDLSSVALWNVCRDAHTLAIHSFRVPQVTRHLDGLFGTLARHPGRCQ